MVRAAVQKSLATALTPGAAVLVGVSGGPDSVALLHVLVSLGYRPHVCHYNHRWRGAESDADEQFVRELARQLGVPVAVGRSRRVPLRPTEDAARRARFAFFERVAKRTRLRVLVLAHTADDQAETVLQRILRGSGLWGLAGIWPDRRIGRLRVLRPMLTVWRKDALRYLQRHRLSYREDTSNRDPRWLRNRIRGELLPLLERQYNPRVRAALCRLAEIARAEVAAESVAVQRRQIRQLSFAQVEALRRALRGDVKVKSVEGKWAVRVPGRTPIPELGLVLESTVLPVSKACWSQKVGASGGWCEQLDAEAVGTGVYVRTWRAGDRFQPLGMSGTKKLQDFFVDVKVPRARRGRIPLLCTADDRIAWVLGYRIAHPFRVTEHTRQVLCVRARSEQPTERRRN